MANGRPGDSLTHDVVHHGREVFGPACDGLIRDIAARLPPGRMGELHAIVETWPFAPDGSPIDTDALFHRLAGLRDRLAAEPPQPLRPPSGRGSVPATGPAAAPPARRGGWGAALIGVVVFLVGGTVSAVVAMVLAMTLGGEAPVGDAAFGWAYGIVFGIMPLAFVLGGGLLAALAVRAARR